MTQKRTVELTILGEPASKANQRRIVYRYGKPLSIKSQKALDYSRSFHEQCPTLHPLMTGDVGIEIVIYYASRRPDLDESLILDLLQGKVYKNDRQVKAKRIVHRLDKDQPRIDLRVSPLEECDFASDIGRRVETVEAPVGRGKVVDLTRLRNSLRSRGSKRR